MASSQQVREHSILLENLAKISAMISALENLLSRSIPKDQAHHYFQKLFDTYQMVQLDVAALEKDLLVLEQISELQSAPAAGDSDI